MRIGERLLQIIAEIFGGFGRARFGFGDRVGKVGVGLVRRSFGVRLGRVL